MNTSPPEQRRIGAVFRLLLHAMILGGSFVLALGVGALVINRLLPAPRVPLITEKLQWFKQHGDDYDVLFIGTSRIYRGVIPAVFDRTAADAGLPLRCFNFGADGLFAPEDSFVLERLVAQRPQRLRWVFIEMSMFRPEFGDRDPESVRSLYWHDFPRTSLVAGAVLFPQDSRGRRKKAAWRSKEGRARLALAALHTRLFFYNALNFGRGGALLEPWTRKVRPLDFDEVLGSDRDGFVAMPIKRRAQELAEFRRRFEERLAKPARRTEIHLHAQKNLDRMITALRRIGAQPVLLIAPTTGDKRLHPRGKSTIPILDFSDPQQWPQLFTEENRADYTHLNKAGAQVFSEALARRFVEIARTSPSALPR